MPLAGFMAPSFVSAAIAVAPTNAAGDSYDRNGLHKDKDLTLWF